MIINDLLVYNFSNCKQLPSDENRNQYKIYLLTKNIPISKNFFELPSLYSAFSLPSSTNECVKCNLQMFIKKIFI